MSEYLAAESPINKMINDNFKETNISYVTEEEKNIYLWEEKLVIDTSKQKISEVIVRKVIETRMLQVPVRREKLIIEQISPEQKQLAEIDLTQSDIAGIELSHTIEPELTSWDASLTVSGRFSSPKIASLLLNAIALETNHNCQEVQVSILVEDEEQRQKYQEWFDRCSQGQSSLIL